MWYCITGRAQPVEIKGALDPNQADILSAYSSEQGEDSALALKTQAVEVWRIVLLHFEFFM